MKAVGYEDVSIERFEALALIGQTAEDAITSNFPQNRRVRFPRKPLVRQKKIGNIEVA